MPELRFEPGWLLVEDAPEPAEQIARSTVFALANGTFGLRGAPEEVPASVQGAKGCYLNGVYDTPRGLLTEREFPNLPDFACVWVEIDGERFDAAASALESYRRELDLSCGLLRRTVDWRTRSGVRAVLTFERFVAMHDANLAWLRVGVAVDRDCRLRLESGIDADVTNRWADHLKEVRFSQVGEAILCLAHTFDPGHQLAEMTVQFLAAPRAGELETTVDAKRYLERYTFELRAGEQALLLKPVAVHADRFARGSLKEACRATLRRALQDGWDRSLARHRRSWAELWERSRVDIEGDDEALLGIRFSQFHLLAAAPYRDARVSVPARGLQGQDYYGSVFWDCEIFVFPFYAYTQPQAARNCVGYRIATLDGARRKAASLGFEGAYYAWQSQETGDDQCDRYVFNNPITGEKIRSYFMDEQIHITADVVHAFRQYAEATGDERFWSEGGAEVVLEAARFFASRCTWVPERNRYEIHRVLGPDEYHENVDNNAFTNAMARETLLTALDLHARGLLRADERDAERWREVAERLYVPEPDPDTGLIEQFDGYFALRDEPIEQTNRRLAHPDLHKGGPLGPFQETRNIKQADVVMLLYLLRDRYSAEVKRANWEFYEPRTAHDSSLSPMAYALVAADVGRTDWAHRYYLYTSHIDLGAYGPHWNHGVHTASLGGAWLAIVHGFLRLRLAPEGPRLDGWPLLPESWRAVEARFVWHGRPMGVRAEPGRVVFENRSSEPVCVALPSGPAEVPPQGRLEAPFGVP
ncbi:MAG: hypothetical protein N2109_06910 [Fimbriimonadales bacterium]|nr:hypothetical protein [Fimbriimonadales bacterium]